MTRVEDAALALALTETCEAGHIDGGISAARALYRDNRDAYERRATSVLAAARFHALGEPEKLSRDGRALADELQGHWGRGLVLEMATAVDAQAGKLRRLGIAIDSLINCVVCARTRNTPEYMIGLAQQINETCEVTGETDRVEFKGDGFVIHTNAARGRATGGTDG